MTMAAIAPLNGVNALYETLGVDVIEAESLGAEWRHVSWHEHNDAAGEFTALDADALLWEAGWERVTPWDRTHDEYAVAEIERIAA